MKCLRTAPSLALCALLLPTLAAGQVAWDAPSMMRPGSPAGLSVFLMDVHPGGGLGGLATWRASPAPVGLGFRAGLAEGPGTDDVSALFGVDVSGSIAGSGGPGTPRLLWWTGAGAGLGDDLLVSFPLGLVAGWQAQEEGVSFAPYVGAHLVLDVRTGAGDGLDLDAAMDLGLDLTFDRSFMVRFGATLGAREALAVGVRLPSGG